MPRWTARPAASKIRRRGGTPAAVYSVFYIIGVVVVVLFILGYFGFR